MWAASFLSWFAGGQAVVSSPSSIYLGCNALSLDACVASPICQLSSNLSLCVNSLPCALETSQGNCSMNTWNCNWDLETSTCRLRVDSPIENVLDCTSLPLESCIQRQTCWFDEKAGKCKRRPTIVLSLADDLGNYDIGWNNPRARTPVLDALRNQGVGLTRHYTARFCAPSRGMLLTGLLPWKLGLQSDLNLNPVYALRCSTSEAARKNFNTRLLPEVLRDHGGYVAHMFGKWHLGNARVADLPTSLGFASFLGFYGGGIENQALGNPKRFQAKQCACVSNRLDGLGKCKTFGLMPLYCSEEVSLVNDTLATGEHRIIDPIAVGEESVDLFLAQQAAQTISQTPINTPLFLYMSWSAPHNPVYAPNRFREMIVKSKPLFGKDAIVNEYCSQDKRLTHLAMVTMMDEAHRVLIQALERAGRYLDSVFVFLSDNGGNGPNYGENFTFRKCSFGHNYPYRGGKFTWWEGGIRNVGLMHAPGRISTNNNLYQGLMSLTDWKATLLDAAGVDVDGGDKDDSVSRWASLTNKIDPSPPRTELALQVWQEEDRFVILFQHNNEWWKVIQGYPWSGTGSGDVGKPNLEHSQSYLLQPPELPNSELDAAEVDSGVDKLCRNTLCLFNLDRDPGERKNYGRVMTSANNQEAGQAKLEAIRLINKYRQQGRQIANSHVCHSPQWFPSRTTDTTDQNAMKMAQKCGGYTAWVEHNNSIRTDCFRYY
ncbi:hypothetical protein BASA81_000554 [Batrachochytrium salamandrivorans]|nr:hypothetical protein BASA81_000554 [Batrachochytrium salamandrivorans]